MILALKAAGPTTQVWLVEDAPTSIAGQLPPTLDWQSGRNLSTELLGRLQELLAQRQFTFKDLTGFIVFSGPGSFTSLRISHTVANALADSLNLPIVGAQGENWLAQGLQVLPQTAPAIPAIPQYGGPAHITYRKSH
jgi:tRNA threonylcarbamoyladenosine biosynthesis protein TsaB